MRVIETDVIAPVMTADDVKSALHILEADDDDLFDTYIVSATDVIETATRRPMVARDVEFVTEVPSAAASRWWFPVAPVNSVTAVALSSAGADFVDLSVDDYALIGSHDEPALHFSGGLSVSGSGPLHIRVQANVGYMDGKWPRGLGDAVRLMVREWYWAGISKDAAALPEMSFAVENLIRQRRYRRPCVWL